MQEPVSFIDYQSANTSISGRITLRQHLFSFLLEGEKTIIYAGDSTSILPGQFLLLSAGNCLMSEKLAQKGSFYRSVLIFFDAELLDEYINSSSDINHNSNQIAKPYLTFAADNYLKHFVASIQLLSKGRTISPEIKRSKLIELLTYINDLHPGRLKELSHWKQSDEELLIKQAASSGIENSVSIEELAFLSNSSVSSFKRKFTKIYGTSPGKWLVEQRMFKAARVLRQSDKKPNEIYLEMGYENLSSFIQSFKQVHGVTPKQYQLANQ